MDTTVALPPACPAHATTRVTVVANVDAEAGIPTAAFDPANPANTSNFSTTITVFDAWGRAAGLNVCFAKTADSTYDYHVLFGSIELGNGSLLFSSVDGALINHSVAVPAQLPGPAGFDAPEISFDFGTPVSELSTGLDGTTSSTGPWNIRRQDQNGSSASFGPDCPTLPADAGPTGPEALRADPVVGVPACSTGETTSFFVAVNLPLSLPVTAARWNYATPITLELTDARGRSAPLLMYFRHQSVATWQYEVEPAEQTSAEPLGSPRSSPVPA